MRHRYILEPYKGMCSRYICPDCQQKGKLVLYIDTETNKPIANNVGKCERVDSCGYHVTPKQYFDANGITQIKTPYMATIAAAPKKTTFIDNKIFNSSLKLYDHNNFFKYLTSLFGIDKANEAATLYHLGTSKTFDNACVFWQVDSDGLIRTGKIMSYNAVTGRRIKEPSNQITWAHKALKHAHFELLQCLFGQHLLADKTKPIAIVESEKTAMIASMYLPQFNWLATSGKTQFTKEKKESLKGHKVVLFPDLGAYESWAKIAKENGFACSDLLERKATEADRENGLDLADFLIREQTVKTGPAQSDESPKKLDTQSIEEKTTVFLQKNEIPVPPQYSNLWDLNFHFTNILVTPIRLNSGECVENPAKCVESHLAILMPNNGKKAYLPYLLRLQQLQKLVNN